MSGMKHTRLTVGEAVVGEFVGPRVGDVDGLEVGCDGTKKGEIDRRVRDSSTCYSNQLKNIIMIVFFLNAVSS